MSYQVFARKYRPRTFADVLGQDHVVQTLKNAIEQKRLAHAYLFVGPRGTGKTSTARIFAKALNCPGGPSVEFDPDDPVCIEIAEGRSLDVLEIDGASNNGVEQVRDLRDNVQFAPSSGQFRIFYIDEVHMLSKQAFNALLKTLEEPPPHVKFIFATTEAHKILPTILSRCQRFDLRPINTETIAKHLLHIASNEGVNLSSEAAYAVAKAADGGMRDAQSMLDQLVSFCGNQIEESHVLDIFGITSRETVGQVIAYMLSKQLSPLLQKLHDQAESGRDLMQFLAEMIFSLREILITKVDPDSRMEGISPELLASIESIVSNLGTSKILRVVEILAETEERMKWATNKRLHMEIGLIKAVHSLSEVNISDIIRALDGAPLIDIKEAPVTIPDSPVIPSSSPVQPPVPAPEAALSPTPPATEDKKEQEEASVKAPAPIAETPTEADPLPEEIPAELPTPAPLPESTDTSSLTPEPEESEPEATPLPPSESVMEPSSAPTPVESSTPVAPSPVMPASGMDDDFFDSISAPTLRSAPSSTPVVSPEPALSTPPSPAPTYEQEPELSPEPDSQPIPEPPPSAPISFIDDSPVRPMEHREEEEDDYDYPDDSERPERPLPIDTNTMSLFGGLDTSEEEIKESIIADASLWQTTLDYIEHYFPVKFKSISHAIFIEHEGNNFVIGINPHDLLAQDYFSQDEFKEKIQAFLKDKTGITLLLKVITTEEAPMPIEEEVPVTELYQPEPISSLKAQEYKPSPEEIRERELAAAAEREEARAAAMKDFYDDPLIQDALDIFHAKIVQ